LDGLGSCDLVGCGDSDGDGVDEVIFTTRGADGRVRVVGYDTNGKKKIAAKYNQFLRGCIVNRPNSQVPLVALLSGVAGRSRQVRVTTMAGSFAFPLFYIDRNATVSSGIFLTSTNEQVPGIFWLNNKSGVIYRRLLTQGADVIELFEIPKDYSLTRTQNIIRTRAEMKR
jgi:hypothetical protein